MDLRLPENSINHDMRHRPRKKSPSVHNLSQSEKGEQTLEVAVGQVDTLFLNSNFEQGDFFNCPPPF